MYNKMYNMNRLCVICFIIFPLCQAKDISLQYNAKLEFDHKKSSNELLGEYDAQSLCLCSTMCKNDCGFYGYNPSLKKCRVHKKTFNSGISDEVGWRYYSQYYSDNVIKLNRDCKDHYLQGQTQSGVYTISPFGNENQVNVYCDMVTEGGGWTAIQKRVSGAATFNKTWSEYKNGFGDPNVSHWIGNDLIHQLTKGNNTSLYVSVTLQNGDTLYEHYHQFSITDEADNYKLFLGGPATGTLDDSMLNTGATSKDLSGMYFTTPDRDHDMWSQGNCAALSRTRGGWWFNSCHRAFLNGPWSPAVWLKPWHPKVSDGKTITETRMLIKRH